MFLARSGRLRQTFTLPTTGAIQRTLRSAIGEISTWPPKFRFREIRSAFFDVEVRVDCMEDATFCPVQCKIK